MAYGEDVSHPMVSREVLPVVPPREVEEGHRYDHWEPGPGMAQPGPSGDRQWQAPGPGWGRRQALPAGLAAAASGGPR